jgi:hypothetical protein
LARPASATYFRFGWLNVLRDELLLALTHQRLTLFHLFLVMIPTGGLVFGILSGQENDGLWRPIVGGAIGLLTGAIVAWLLPRTLLVIFWLMQRQGWLLQPAPPVTAPLISAEEFSRRADAFNRQELRQSIYGISHFVGAAVVAKWLFGYMSRANVESWASGTTAVFILGYFVASILCFRVLRKRLARKHGMYCPNCNRLITDAAGACRVPYMGVCRHCGAKIIDV